MKSRGSLAFALLLAAPAFAGTGGEVDVRAVDVYSGDVLAEETIATEQRLELRGTPDHMRYLGIRRAQMQDREVLELSLAATSDAWQQAGFAAWNEPSIQTFGRVGLEIAPQGWANRYCRRLAESSSSARRDPSVGLVIDGSRHVSRDGWSGEGQVDLVPVASPESDPQWQARIDSDGKLHVREGDLGTWRAIDPVRDDFFMTRRLFFPAGRVEVTYDPGSYAHRFCDRYENQGERYAETVVDHIFGRQPRGSEENDG